MSDAKSQSESPRPPVRRGPMGGGMRMAMPAEKAMSFGPSAKRLFKLLLPEQFRMAVVFVLTIVSVTLTVLGPRVMGHATDIIFGGFVGKQFPAGISKADAIAHARDSGNSTLADTLSKVHFTPGIGINTTQLAHVLMLGAALFIGGSVFAVIQGWVLNGVLQRTVYRLRADVEHKINRLPLSYFDNKTRGEVLSRVTNDIDNIQQSLQQTLAQSFNAVITVIGVLIMMFVISPLLAVIGLLTVPLSLFVTSRIARRSQKHFVKQWGTTGKLNGHVEEAITGHSLVKVFGRQSDVEAVFEQHNQELYEASFGAQFVSGTIMPAMFFIGNLNYVVLAVVGGLRVASGAMTIGSVQAFITYSRQFTQPLTQLASMVNVLQSGVASAERVFELLDAEEMSVEPERVDAGSIARGEISFDGVDFSYLADQPLIEDLSFTAEPGHTIAIVGPTGAGKTTLVNLIMRFYEIQDGRITLDDVDTATIPRHQLRSKVGMVLQDAWLFGGTIRDNIAYGNLNATEEDIQRAAEATFVDRFVRVLPDGYDTVINDEGTNISAGEKQLITIARAFLADPALLILDEATSSVDTRTELLVQQAMAALRRDRTSFVIAHRLSTIRDADLILVMNHGKIVEQGTHETLLQAHGAYYELYNSQFQAAIVDDEEEQSA